MCPVLYFSVTLEESEVKRFDSRRERDLCYPKVTGEGSEDPSSVVRPTFNLTPDLNS